jgi:DivIVA domain-containing protein
MGEQGEKQVDPLRAYVPQELLDVSFPAAVRGYDRDAVDAYVQQVNRAIAELKVRSSPPAAVRHAIEEAESTVQGLLNAAHAAADQITETARREADESVSRAKTDAASLLVDSTAEADRTKAEAEEVVANAKKEAESIIARAQAEADEHLHRFNEELAARRQESESRMRQLQSDTDVVWNERRELLADLRRMSDELVDLAKAAEPRSRGKRP